jgi:hypothetical protein
MTAPNTPQMNGSWKGTLRHVKTVLSRQCTVLGFHWLLKDYYGRKLSIPLPRLAIACHLKDWHKTRTLLGMEVIQSPIAFWVIFNPFDKLLTSQTDRKLRQSLTYVQQSVSSLDMRWTIRATRTSFTILRQKGRFCLATSINGWNGTVASQPRTV